MQYKIRVSKDNAGYIATCRELPDFVAVSGNLEDLSRLAIKNLTLMIGAYLTMAEPVPHSPVCDEPGNVWHPSLSIRLKVVISNRLIEKGWSRDNFRQAMGLTPSSMNNFFDSEVSTRLSTLDRAFQILGLYPHLDILESPGELMLSHEKSPAVGGSQPAP